MITVLLFGCLTQNNFDERYAEAFCEYAQQCEVLDLEGFSTVQECENETVLLPDTCDTFDRKKAKDCIEQLSTISCKQALSGIPKTCDKVCP